MRDTAANGPVSFYCFQLQICHEVLLLLLLLSSSSSSSLSSNLLSPSCRVFTITYLKHHVAAVLYLQFVLHVMLFRPRNMFCTFTSALSAVSVQCPVWLCSSLISCFAGMWFRHCLGVFEIVPVAPIITGITFAFTFHMYWISIMRSLYSKIIIINNIIISLLPPPFYEELTSLDQYKNQQYALIKIKQNRSQNTLHNRCQLLHVSAPRCYHQGVLQQQRFVGPTSISGNIRPHFHQKTWKS